VGIATNRPRAPGSWSASAVADSPVAASSDKQERQDRAQKYRARAGDILKLTDGDILPDQRERHLKSVHYYLELAEQEERHAIRQP
jgi:hypothetical protein